MFIYLVRHAEGRNAEKSWQTPNTKLSSAGRKQASALAKLPRFKKAEIIFSSEWARVKETAEAVSINLKLPIQISVLIHEREQPAELYGKKRTSPFSTKYSEAMIKNSKNLDWNFEGKEESIRDVVTRSLKFQMLLKENYQQKQVLVFSHDVFIRCFISSAILGKQYDDNSLAKLIRALEISPAGVSLLQYRENRNSWKLWYLNDLAYLRFMEK